MTRNEHAFDPSTYDADFFTWTQQQAAALRAMPSAASVDVANVAEEIEDLGKSELHGVFSFLVLVLQHLMKLHIAPTSRDAGHWYQEASNFQSAARRKFSPGMRQSIDVSEAWTDAWHGLGRFRNDIGAVADLSDVPCPFMLDDLLSKPFDIEAALARIAAARDTPRP